jgi:transposase
MMLTFKYRVKDASSRRHLARHARACNQVWNFCAATQREAERRWKAGRKIRWPTAFDLIKLCTGAAASLGLHSDTVQTICRQFAASRDAKRRAPKFRASFGSKKALGWIPFIPRAIRVGGSTIVYLKRKFCFWKSRNIGGEIKCGSFVEDARGRWYVSFQCEVPDNLHCGNGEVGIDLGLKTVAAMSDGTKIENQKLVKRYAGKLAIAQRARNKRRVQAIHAKIVNARRHQLHVASTELADANSLIVVGDVSPTKLTKTKMAKSVLDAGWSTFKEMLRYKVARRRAVFLEVSERWTSQTCSSCGCISASSPKGMGALGVRHWDCLDCGASHDRDTNSALNILRVGLERQPLVEEIPGL